MYRLTLVETLNQLHLDLVCRCASGLDAPSRDQSCSVHPDTLQEPNRPLCVVRAGAAPQPAASLERAGGGTPGESVMLRSTTGDAMSDVRDVDTAAAAGDAGSNVDAAAAGGGGSGGGSSAYTTCSPFVEVAVMVVTR
jgi:hypothetical protein